MDFYFRSSTTRLEGGSTLSDISCQHLSRGTTDHQGDEARDPNKFELAPDPDCNNIRLSDVQRLQCTAYVIASSPACVSFFCIKNNCDP